MGARILRSIASLALAFAVCLALFSVLKLASTLVPASALHDSLARSVEILESEGGDYDYLVGEEDATLIDNYTSALILNMCASDYESGLQAAFADWHYKDASGAGGQTDSLRTLVSAGVPRDVPGWSPYAYYWNGPIVVIKPLLAFLDLAGIRLLFTIVIAAILIADAILLARASSVYAGFAFALPFAAVCLPAATMSLSLAFTFLIASVSTLFALLSYRRRGFDVRCWLVPFFVFGAATAFFDMLCTPIITLGIPLGVLTFLGADRWRSAKKSTLVAWLLLTALCWALGYGLLWVAKWVIATIVLGHNVVNDALSEFAWRTSLTGQDSEAIRPWSAAHVNLGALLSFPGWIPCAILAVAAIVIGLVRRKPAHAGNARTAVMLIAIAILPYLWYTFASNHSCIHYAFTYRGQAVTILCLLLAIGALFLPSRKEDAQYKGSSGEGARGEVSQGGDAPGEGAQNSRAHMVELPPGQQPL